MAAGHEGCYQSQAHSSESARLTHPLGGLSAVIGADGGSLAPGLVSVCSVYPCACVCLCLPVSACPSVSPVVSPKSLKSSPEPLPRHLTSPAARRQSRRPLMPSQPIARHPSRQPQLSRRHRRASGRSPSFIAQDEVAVSRASFPYVEIRGFSFQWGSPQNRQMGRCERSVLRAFSALNPSPTANLLAGSSGHRIFPRRCDPFGSCLGLRFIFSQRQ